jgi:hypothetical protein
MDVVRKIFDSQTVEELLTLESLYDLNEYEQGLVFERKVEVITRRAEWAIENERMGLPADLTDNWTHEQGERFIRDWENDEPFQQMMLDDDLMQFGRGQKRPVNEVNDGASTSNEVSDSDFFTLTNYKQVNVRKFSTTGVDYTVQFTNTFANLELSQYHNRLHEIFESLLSRVTSDISMNDQVRFVLQSPQLNHPISLPFMPLSRLTTERVLAEFERVVQSNRHFRLNDSVLVNMIHVEMPHGDEVCLARALVVSIAKIENDARYKTIVDHRGSLQERLAYDLHEKAGVEIGACGLNEVKQFQIYLSDYQINIVSKEHLNSIIFSGPEKDKKIYLFLHDQHYNVITSMPAFFARKRYCHTCKTGYDHVRDHRCPDACKLCLFPNCPVVSWLPCVDCNRASQRRERVRAAPFLSF